MAPQEKTFNVDVDRCEEQNDDDARAREGEVVQMNASQMGRGRPMIGWMDDATRATDRVSRARARGTNACLILRFVVSSRARGRRAVAWDDAAGRARGASGRVGAGRSVGRPGEQKTKTTKTR